MLERLGPRACASHDTAAQLWGLPLVGEPASWVTVPRDRSRVAIPGWQVRRADLGADDVVVIEGLRATTPLQTVLDLTMVLPLGAAVATADAALREGQCSLEELRSVLGRRLGRGAGRPRAVADMVDRSAESVLESLLRVILAQAGLRPRSQFEVRDGGRVVARLDFAFPEVRLAVEADGFAHHADRASFRRDRERTNELERLGWRVLRFTWEDVHRRPDHVVALVRACLTRAA